MPELQLDVTIANRFISSLSKSLQALCHGCMDFDNGIEIIGYINVNIDSGSKVDYVLNEKVLKSTTNSMTFVSNSFLARKEQVKQTRDGACSPVYELQAPPQNMAPYTALMKGTHIGSQYHRSTSQFSPHSHSLRGAQKRGWTSDWRVSSKRQRHQNFSGESQHSQTSSQTSTESNFKQPQLPSATDSGTGDNNEQLINVKKELEADSLASDNDQCASFSQSPSSQSHELSSNLASKIKIKRDPDVFPSNKEDNPVADDNARTFADLKDSFLQTPATEDASQEQTSLAEEGSSQTASAQFLSYDSLSKEQTTSDNQGAENTFEDHNETEVPYDNEPSGSDLPEDIPQAAEEGSYSQTAYSDAGEGSSDAGQFEVIEIDDEDEDVQAMLNDPHRASSVVSRPHLHQNVMLNASSTTTATRLSDFRHEPKEPYSIYDPNSQLYTCAACGKEYKSSSGVRLHYKIKHFGYFDHYCQACGKGFQQKSHLKAHMSLHMQQRDFKCDKCGAQYAHKTSLTAHQKLMH